MARIQQIKIKTAQGAEIEYHVILTSRADRLAWDHFRVYPEDFGRSALIFRNKEKALEVKENINNKKKELRIQCKQTERKYKRQR